VEIKMEKAIFFFRGGLALRRGSRAKNRAAQRYISMAA